MDKELVQNALVDVAKNPELYYQGFIEDKLPLINNVSKEQFVSLFSKDENVTKQVLTKLSQDENALASIVKTYQSKNSVFKNGGKFEYLEKLQGGGNLKGDRKPSGIKGWTFSPTKYPRQDQQPGFLSSYITPAQDTITTVGGRWNTWRKTASPNGVKYEIAIGSDDFKPTKDQEAIEMLNNVQNRFTYPKPVKKQEGGQIQKWQFGASVPLSDELQRIPKYGHLRLLRQRNSINTSKIDSTFTFIPENKNSYIVPEGTYTRTNYDNEPLYRGFKPTRSDSYQEGTPAIRNFNALRQLWEYAKQNNK